MFCNTRKVAPLHLQVETAQMNNGTFARGPLIQPLHGWLDKEELSARKVGFLFVFSITVALVIGALLWILNMEDILHGPWSAILNVICTVLSVALNAWQWHAQAFADDALHHTQQDHIVLKQNLLGINTRCGALALYTGKKSRRQTLYLIHSLSIAYEQ